MNQQRTRGGRFDGGSPLDDATLSLIRRLAAAGESHGSLARRFGRSRSSITRLVAGSRRAAALARSREGPQGV